MSKVERGFTKLGIMLVTLLIIIMGGVFSYLKSGYDADELVKSFRNGEVLVCYETLIVTDSNWELSEYNLINNNSAGYLDIRNCVKKD